MSAGYFKFPHHVCEQWVGGGRERRGSRSFAFSLSHSLTNRHTNIQIFENFWPTVTFSGFFKNTAVLKLFFWQENVNENWHSQRQDRGGQRRNVEKSTRLGPQLVNCRLCNRWNSTSSCINNSINLSAPFMTAKSVHGYNALLCCVFYVIEKWWKKIRTTFWKSIKEEFSKSEESGFVFCCVGLCGPPPLWCTHLLVFCTSQEVLLSTAHLRFLRGFFFLRTCCAKRR